ncbi:hypothetical protein EGO53_11595 [Serratia liquefaciens]|uniref:Uncharacterized protein n=1 Tax=Serratia liquefaciens TaxID=614 RepID=A0A515CW66_SERLI|nr:hypothetical protein EGO53_11595 [Serratia liquefaciens]
MPALAGFLIEKSFCAIKENRTNRVRIYTKFCIGERTMNNDLAAAIAIGSVLLFNFLIGPPITICPLLP